MRVMLITGSFPPMHCGVGDYTCKLAAALAERADLCVTVLTSRGAETPKAFQQALGVLDAEVEWPPDTIPEQGVRWYGSGNGFHIEGDAIRFG